MEEINRALGYKLESHDKAIQERLGQQDCQFEIMNKQINGNHEIKMRTIANLIDKMDEFSGTTATPLDATALVLPMGQKFIRT